MKTKDFERILREMGFAIVRQSSHTVWSNGRRSVAIPHDKEINKMLARRLLKEIGYSKRVSELNYG